MLRHLPYHEVLGDAHEGLPIWAPTLAGLAVLELVDAARHDRSIVDRDWTGVRAAADAVTGLSDGLPVKRLLMNVVDQLRDGAPSWSGVNKSLFAYARGLDLDGNWSLAVDVFGTVADIAREDREPQLAIEATTALGGAARRCGDWDTSADSYAQAAHLAETLGDKASGLTVRVGTANTHVARGNLPAARQILDEVIAESGGLNGVQALAYHARASVAHLQGDYGTTVTLANKALGLTANQSAKDSILADIAAAFAEMGLRDSARDSHMVIALTSRYQWVRWQSTINLMELAALDGMEEAFFGYARELRNAALDPRLRSYFLLYYGQGLLAFGRDSEGMETIGEARDFASQHKIHQVSHDAAAALAGAGREALRRQAAKPWAPEKVPSDVFEVAEAMSGLRDSALAASLADQLYQGPGDNHPGQVEPPPVT